MGSKEENKTHTLKIRVSKKDYDIIKKHISKLNNNIIETAQGGENKKINVSSYIRGLLEKDLKIQLELFESFIEKKSTNKNNILNSPK